MNKKNLVLAGVLLSLVAISYVYQGPMQNWKNRASKINNFLENLNIDDVDKIEISKSGDSIQLEKDNDRWKISGTKNFYVKKEIMSNIASSLEKTTKAELDLVSAKPEKKSDFMVGDNGNRIRLSKGDSTLTEFIVGKRTNDYQGVYIALLESDETYSIKSDLAIFDRDDWYDKNIFDVEKEKINKVRFQYPGREFTIEKKEDKWGGILPYKFGVNEEKINKILDIMTKLDAIDIPEQTFEGTGLENHEIIVQVTGDEGIDYAIMVGSIKKVENDEQELYFAKKGDSDNIYLITKEQRDELEKQIWELK